MSLLDRLRAAAAEPEAGFAAPGRRHPQPLTVRKWAPEPLEPYYYRPGTSLAVTTPRGPSISESRAHEIVQEELLKLMASEQDVAGIDKPLAAGGRQTLAGETFSLLPNAWSPVQTDYPFDLMKVVENLCLLNRHFSYGVDNIINLAATEKEITFDPKIPVEQSRLMLAHLADVESGWYDFSDGGTSSERDVIAQLATFGALCFEIVVKRDLSGIDYLAKVGPASIRFMLDQKTGRWKPLQQQGVLGGQPVQNGVPAGYRELNPRTFKYITMRRWKTSPYPVIPFASAVEDVYTENDMLSSFRSMMRRLGMMGFLTVLVEAPKQLPNNQETELQYRSRMNSYLQNTVLPMAETAAANGVVAGFKGNAEFKVEGSPAGSSLGAEKFLGMIQQLVFSGLKQDPNMHGVNQATTETFGRVILTKMAQQSRQYQTAAASFWEQVYMTELSLAGFAPGFVKVKYKPALLGDQLRDAQAEQAAIQNAINKRNQGFINQTQAAQELGYDSPDLTEPPATAFAPVAGAPGASDGPGGRPEAQGPGTKKPTKDKEQGKASSNAAPEVGAARAALGAAAPGYHYDVPVGCEPPALMLASSTSADRLEAQVGTYMREVLGKMSAGWDATRPVLRAALRKLPADADVATIQNVALATLYTSWKQTFAAPVAKVAGKRQRSIYREFRKDNSVFTQAANYSRGRGNFFTVPAAVFNQKDYRAMEYLGELDGFYLGKFITDPDTERRILDFISQQVLGEGSPVARGSVALGKFLDAFGDVVANESWKARRIIETAANKARNYANLAYIEQAGVEEFEIVEVMDRLTCAHCQHMNGQVFQVDTAAAQIDKITNSPAGDTPELSPFATALPIDQFKGMDAAQLQAAGINTPSYHPHCRGRVVAVL